MLLVLLLNMGGNEADWAGGWPTFTLFVKVGTHAARADVFDLCFHSLIRTAAGDVDTMPA